MSKGKRYFLTGGAGFIGTKICERIGNDDANEILLYDNLNRNSIKNTDLLNRKNIRLIQGDILDFNFLKQVIQEFRPNIVIHLAAIAGVDNVINHTILTMKVNMLGIYHVLEAIKELDSLERLVNFSTSEVFGSYAFKVDEQSSTNLAPVGEVRWAYSASKLAGEHLANSYYKELKLPVVTIRPFNIYGPGQVGEGAIHTFIVNALKNEEIIIFGEGDQIRSWCYIDDFVDGVLLCITKSEAIGNAFNIGSPQGTITINHLADMIVMLSGSKSPMVHLPENYVDVELRMPSIDKARRILGYQPRIGLKEGIIRTLDWYRRLL